MVAGRNAAGYFYPRSPCGERQKQPLVRTVNYIFLSTLSLRRATAPKKRNQKLRRFLSTLSLRRATLRRMSYRLFLPFLSTLSLRRATPLTSGTKTVFTISIHALLAESDGFGPAWLAPGAYFYPRSPCGERHADTKNTSFHKLFLSTLSLRRATADRYCHDSDFEFLSTLSLRRATQALSYLHAVAAISIHALLAESDQF